MEDRQHKKFVGVRFNEPVQVQKMESIITLYDCETTSKKKTVIPVFTCSGKV